MSDAADVIAALEEAIAAVEPLAPTADTEILIGARVSTYADAGVLTTNDGLVIRLADGSEFQVTVVQSR